jgi:hypothetical protein
MYAYGCQVICPNEWGNSSANTGLWIPGYNPQLLAALQTFVGQIQDYPRGAAPSVHVNAPEIAFYENFNVPYALFSNSPGLFVMGGAWLACVIYWAATVIRMRKKKVGQDPDQDASA